MGLIVGAITGGLIAILWALVIKVAKIDTKRHGATIAVVYALLFTVGMAVANTFVTPIVFRYWAAHKLRDYVATQPTLVALKKHAPLEFEAAIAEAEEGLRKGDEMGLIQEKMRGHLTGFISKQLPIASNAAVISYMRVTVQEVRELHAVGDDACHTYLFPGTGQPFDIVKRIKPETLKADLDGLAAVLESAASKPEARVPLTQVKNEIDAVIGSLSAKYGERVQLMSQPQSSLANKRMVCEMIADLYSSVLAMPSERSGPVLRAMLSE